MKVLYTKPALADLQDIAGHIEKHSSQRAFRVRQRIKRLIEHIADQPFLGKVTDDPTIRQLTAAPYPYIIFYEVTDAQIIVHAVRHGARDPSTMPGHR